MKRTRKIVFAISLAVLITCMWQGTCKAYAANKYPQQEIYETDASAGYSMESSNAVSKFSYGDDSIGSFWIEGNIVTQSEYADYMAYGVSDVVAFEYSYAGNYNSGKKTSWNIISDDKKTVAGISADTKIKEGMILVQKSSDGVTWVNATSPINDYFSKSTADECTVYKTTVEEIKQGTYYRVVVAYSMKIKTGTNDGWLFFDSDIYDTKSFVEVYKFYVCTESNYTVLRDSITKEAISSGKTIQQGFYIDKNGSADEVKVSKNNASAKTVSNFDSFTEPGEYVITTTTKLGKLYTQKINVSEGLHSLTLSPDVYECKKGKGFVDGILKTGSTSYGIKAYTELEVAQNAGFITTKSTYNGFDAYGVNGDEVCVFMKLNYPVSLNGKEWSVTDSSWGKKEKEKICGVHTGEMGTGAIIIQTSTSGKDGTWQDVDKGKYASGLYTTDYGTHYSKDEGVLVYMPDGDAVLNGVYIRVMYAYQVYNKTEKEYVDCVEKYEFYLCSNALGAVTFHNASLTDSIEEVLGDEDENVIAVYKQAESLVSGSSTFTGFSIDRSKNPTVTYTIKKDGKAISASRDHKYTVTGRYDIELVSAVGDKQTVTIYVDRSSNEEALKNYFGDGFIAGKRVYAEGEYPVYEGGSQTTYNLVEVSESYQPISGEIKNLDTGEVIEISKSRAARSEVLTVPGEYEAILTTGESVGDVRTFKFYFRIIAEGTAPGPVINRNNLLNYAQKNISDVYPIGYALTYPSASTGYIHMVFHNKEDAIEYAYNHEKGTVEQQSDGSYRYNGKLEVAEKEKYDSLWDLTDAMYYFAELAVKRYYFDLSDEYKYRTLSEDVLKNTSNPRTLELDRTVAIFGEGQKEKMVVTEALPIISEKPYLYLTPGIGGVDTKGYTDFEFIQDKYSCDSYTIYITDKNGIKYDIEYNCGVGAQLREAGCPSGIVTITETTIYGDSASYEAVYIAEGENTSEIDILYFDTGKENVVTLSAKDNGMTVEADAFSIEKVVDILDPYSLVLITKDNKIVSYYCCDQVMKEAWAEAGKYTVKIVNRLGYTLSFDVMVRESDYSVITFAGDGTEDVKDIITSYGENGVALPNLSRVGYEFLGYEDQNGAKYEAKLDVNFKTVLQLNALWKPKQVEVVIKDSLGNVIETKQVDYGTSVELTIPVLQEGQEFVEWQLNGDVLVDATLSVNTEDPIVVLCVTRGGFMEDETTSEPDLKENLASADVVWMKIIVVFAVFLLFTIGVVAIRMIRKKRVVDVASDVEEVTDDN